MLADLLAHPGVEEVCDIRGRFGLMAPHGGSLERGTDEVASAAAERAGASYYAVRQPPDLTWHVPSIEFDPAASLRLAAFLDHVDTVVTVHGFGREGCGRPCWSVVATGRWRAGWRLRCEGRWVTASPWSTTSRPSPRPCGGCTLATRSTGPACKAPSSSCRRGSARARAHPPTAARTRRPSSTHSLRWSRAGPCIVTGGVEQVAHFIDGGRRGRRARSWCSTSVATSRATTGSATSWTARSGPAHPPAP